MNEDKIIKILQYLSRSRFSGIYSDEEYIYALEYAINKIRSYNDLQSHYMALSIDYAAFREHSKHHSSLPVNY